MRNKKTHSLTFKKKLKKVLRNIDDIKTLYTMDGYNINVVNQ